MMVKISLIDDNTGLTTKEIECKFKGFQEVWYVEKRRNKIYIIEDEIGGISYTNMLSYKLIRSGYFIAEDSKNLFGNFDDAMDRAEQLEIRKKIKIIRR